MKKVSIRSHMVVAFAMIAMIPVIVLGFLQRYLLLEITEKAKGQQWEAVQQLVDSVGSLQFWGMTIFILLSLLFLIGYVHATRINRTIRLLVEYIQQVMSEEQEVPIVRFPKFAPYDFEFFAQNFYVLAQKLKEGQQTLRELNADLETRVAERTKSLSRSNRELAILNQLITPITPSPGGASIIRGCLREFFELSNVKVVMYLAKPVSSLFGSYEDVADSGIDYDKIRHKNSHRYHIQPIRSEKTTYGYFVVPNSPMSEGDLLFLQTLAHYAAILLKNEILSRTLQHNHAVLKAVLESMNDAIVLIDDNRHEIVYANGRMEELFQIAGDALCGSPETVLFTAIADILRDPDEELIRQIRQEYGVYKLPVSLAGKEERSLLLSSFPVTDTENHTIGKGYLWRDITTDLEVEKLKSDLISLVSHEFKTPLTSIKGSVETLLRRDAAWDESFKQELLLGIHEDIDCIQTLVNDWLDLSRIDARAIGLNREPVRLDAVVKSAIRKLPKHFANGILIEVYISNSLPLLYGDRLRLEQVVSNLLSNAIRYNNRKPHIKITGSSDDRYVHIRVEDNGIGIEDKHLGKIFDRFCCLDTGWVRRAGGSGLGLAICKGIMEAHDGIIRVESSPGLGSAFTVSVPRHKFTEGDPHEEI